VIQFASAFADLDSDGRSEVLVFTWNGNEWERRVYDSTGMFISKDTCVCEHGSYRVRFPAPEDEWHYLRLGAQRQELEMLPGLYTLFEEPVAVFDAGMPETNDCFEGFPATVAFHPIDAMTQYMVLSFNFCWDSNPQDAVGETLNRTRLTIYDPAGFLIYHEVLEASLSGMTAIPNAGGAEDLLVGTLGKVYRYRVTEQVEAKRQDRL